MCSENVGDTEEIFKEDDGSGEPKTKLLILYAFQNLRDKRVNEVLTNL